MANACTNLTSAVRVVQLLKIDGYSASQGDGCIRSIWNVGGYEWETHLYPSTTMFQIGADDPLFWKPREPVSCDDIRRGRAYTSRFLSLELAFIGEPRNVRASLACRLVDPRGVLEPSQEKSVSHLFWVQKKYSSTLMLIERRDLEASGYLRDDCLALQCIVTVQKLLPVATIPAEEVVLPPSSNLQLHFGELLQSGIGADVTFVVSGESFAAHKAILSSRSPVFMAEFFGEMKEKCSQRVEIKDMEAAAFSAMLHFIYTDSVPELDQQLEAVATMAQHLLAAADRYGLDRLKLICELKLSGGITVDTAATTLALAEQHNCSQLKAKCVDFIVSTPAVVDAVLATEGFKHLTVSCPLVLADLLKFVHGRKS